MVLVLPFMDFLAKVATASLVWRFGDFELREQATKLAHCTVCLYALAWPACVPFSAVSLLFSRPVEGVQEGSRRGSEG